jgi:hypothetical protein
VIASRGRIVALLIGLASPAFAADRPAAPAIVLEGKLKLPQALTLEALRQLPSERVQVAFQSERGATTASYTGVRLWAVLTLGGGIDDDEKGAVLRHLVKITGRDGYVVVLSTGEIAPDFGGEAAIIAYQRGDQPLGEEGLRLVIPGDKRGGRNVRDVVAIRVE